MLYGNICKYIYLSLIFKIFRDAFNDNVDFQYKIIPF